VKWNKKLQLVTIRFVVAVAVMILLWVEGAGMDVETFGRLPLASRIEPWQGDNFKLTMDWPSISLTCF
jgi:hypothetical protein